jgi:hypothetical protein
MPFERLIKDGDLTVTGFREFPVCVIADLVQSGLEIDRAFTPEVTLNPEFLLQPAKEFHRTIFKPAVP